MNEIFKLLLVGGASVLLYKTWQEKKEEDSRSNPDSLEVLDLQRRLDELSTRSNNIHPALNQPAMMPPPYQGYGYGSYGRGLF